MSIFYNYSLSLDAASSSQVECGTLFDVNVQTKTKLKPADKQSRLLNLKRLLARTLSMSFPHKPVNKFYLNKLPSFQMKKTKSMLFPFSLKLIW